MIESMIESVIIKIWFFIPVAVVGAGFLLYIIHRKYKTDILAVSSILCMVFILWSIISVIIWRDQAKIPTLREMYRSQVKTEGIDENGDLWIVVEADDEDNFYSIERGDHVLRLIEEGVTLSDYPIGDGEFPETLHYWRYRVVGEGECDLYKIRKSNYTWKSDETVAYRIAVDGNGNITKTVDYGETPGWLQSDDFEITKYSNEDYDYFAKNVIFLYGENRYCKEPEMIRELCPVFIKDDSHARWPDAIYICLDIRTIFYCYTKANNVTEWKEFRIADGCDISWIEKWTQIQFISGGND